MSAPRGPLWGGLSAPLGGPGLLAGPFSSSVASLPAGFCRPRSPVRPRRWRGPALRPAMLRGPSCLVLRGRAAVRPRLPRGSALPRANVSCLLSPVALGRVCRAPGLCRGPGGVGRGPARSVPRPGPLCRGGVSGFVLARSGGSRRSLRVAVSAYFGWWVLMVCSLCLSTFNRFSPSAGGADILKPSLSPPAPFSAVFASGIDKSIPNPQKAALEGARNGMEERGNGVTGRQGPPADCRGPSSHYAQWGRVKGKPSRAARGP